MQWDDLRGFFSPFHFYLSKNICPCHLLVHYLASSFLSVRALWYLKALAPSSQKNSAQKYQNSARSCAYCSHNSGEVSWLPYSTYFLFFFKGIYGWHTNISFWSKSWRCLIWRFALSKGYRNRIRTTFQLLTLHLASYSSIEKSLILLYLILCTNVRLSGKLYSLSNI